MGVAIRTAGEGDRELVVRLLDQAFQDDPVSGWVFPGAEYRRSTHHRLMAAFTGIVLDDGRIDVTEDGSACALWLSVPAEAHDADDDGPAQLRAAVDPGNERVELIGWLTARIHPVGRAHEYLWMIGVAPERQGEGLGRARPARPRPLRPRGPARLSGGQQRSQPRTLRALRLRTRRPPPGASGWPADVADVARTPRLTLRLNQPSGGVGAHVRQRSTRPYVRAAAPTGLR